MSWVLSSNLWPIIRTTLMYDPASLQGIIHSVVRLIVNILMLGVLFLVQTAYT